MKQQGQSVGLPTQVFVYGTLRPGQSNFDVVRRYVVSSEPANLRGASMTASSFPYVWRTSTGTVWGDLLVIDPTSTEAALRALDRLEGYAGPGMNNHYDRAAVQVVTNEGRETKAWTYLVDEFRASAFAPVRSGDFLSRY